MTRDEVMAQLEAWGDPQTKKTFLRHGAKEPFFGVKISNLKLLQKKIKQDNALANELYATGNSDAMYLAGLIADGPTFKKADLERWVKGAPWHMISHYTVPWVAAESRYGAELARKWIDSKSEQIASAGWATFASMAATLPDEKLDLAEFERLVDRAMREIHAAPNLVRYVMNGFLIAVGGAIKPLHAKAKAAAKKVGAVAVDMGDTECKVPLATDYIDKVVKAGKLGVKRKSAKC
jgi:3-methyladenine DNA glycosylase AlkD